MAFTKKRHGKNISIECTDKDFLAYKEVCSLGKQLQSLKNKVDEDDLFIITLDELKGNPDKVFNNLLVFLKLDNISPDSYDRINEKKIRQSYFFSNLLNSTNKCNF